MPSEQAPRQVLRVAVSRALPDALVVRPAGEADLATAGSLRDAVIEAIEERPRSVVVDLSGLVFCGAAGLAALVHARGAAAAAGVRFAVTYPRRHLRRVIEVTGLREELALHETLDEALGLPRRATCSPLGALGYRES